METREATYTIKGILNDTDTCECCGRTGLKRVVALAELDADGNEGEVAYFGTACAARAIRWTSTRVTNEANAAQHKRDQQAEWANGIIAVYGPVEFGSVREKAELFFGRNPVQRFKEGVKASEEVAKLLAEARTALAVS